MGVRPAPRSASTSPSTLGSHRPGGGLDRHPADTQSGLNRFGTISVGCSTRSVPWPPGRTRSRPSSRSLLDLLAGLAPLSASGPPAPADQVSVTADDTGGEGARCSARPVEGRTYLEHGAGEGGVLPAEDRLLEHLAEQPDAKRSGRRRLGPWRPDGGSASSPPPAPRPLAPRARPPAVPRPASGVGHAPAARRPAGVSRPIRST